MGFVYISVPTPKDNHISVIRDYSVRVEGGYYLVIDVSTNLVIIKLRVREDYPSTFCYVSSAGAVFCGYGKEDAAADEDFLYVTLERDGEITIQRDVLCTLPLFYGQDRSKLIISNEYAEVWHGLSEHTLPTEHVLTETLMPSGLRLNTFSVRIKLLHELETLHFKDFSLHVLPGLARPWNISREAPKSQPRDFMPMIEGQTERLLQRLSPYSRRVVFEISGGLDSSFLPLYVAQKYPGTIEKLSSMHFPGVFRQTQERKLARLQKIVGGQRLSLLLDSLAHYPLAGMLKRAQPFYGLRGIYEEATDAYAKTLAQAGRTILLMGEGGDELFDNSIDVESVLAYGNAELKRRSTMKLPVFLTEYFREVYVATTPLDAPRVLPQLATNFHGAAIARNNSFIRHDIWPVSPFANRDLYFFCQGLPAHFRANKNIFRAYYQAKKWPKSIYQPRVNEDYGEFFDSAFLSGFYNKIIAHFCTYGYTVKNGLVDPSKLQESLSDCLEGRVTGDARNQQFFYMYMWLVTELNLAQFAS